LVDDAAASNARATLGVVIGTDVQAHSANLDSWSALATSAKQDADGNLTAIAGLSSAVDTLPYFTGTETAALTAFTSTARSLLDDTSISAMRTTLGVAIGTDVQAYDVYLDQISAITSPDEGAILYYDGTEWAALPIGENNQILQYNDIVTGSLRWVDIAGNDGLLPVPLNVIGNLTPAADQLPYYTGESSAALTTLTSFGRSLIDDTDAATARTTLGVVIGTDVQAWDQDLADISGLTRGKGSLLVGTASAWTLLDVGTDNQALIVDSTQTSGVKWGSPISDPELSAIAGLTSAADTLPYFTGSGTADLASFTSTARSLLDDADTATMRTTLGVVIGTDVQAWDDDLDTIAGLAHTKGGLIVGGASGWSFLGVGSDGEVLTADSGEIPGLKWDTAGSGGGASAAYRNRLINPFGRWKQSGVGAQTDGVYGFDQWYALVQNAAITSSQLTDVEDGVPYGMRYTQSQGTAQRFGIAQPLESLESKDLRGKDVTLKARVRCSAATTLRYAIIEWTGTADTITKDFVADWSNTTFTAGNFFTSTSTVITATGSVALAADTLTDVKLTGTVGSSANNIVVLFWTDSAQAYGTTLDISATWFGQGDSPTVVEFPVVADDWDRCQRFYEKSYEPDEAIGTINPATGIMILMYIAYGGTTAAVTGGWLVFKKQKVKVPTVTTYSPATGSAGQLRSNSVTSGTAGDVASTVTQTSTSGTEILGTQKANTGGGANLVYCYTADARL
jgi:hypothetical protein